MLWSIKYEEKLDFRTLLIFDWWLKIKKSFEACHANITLNSKLFSISSYRKILQ